MPKKMIATTVSTAALIGAVFIVLPASAGAEYYVPPGNSAVNQYTESFPGAGGETGGDGNGKGVTSAQTLGAGNAKRLERQGQAGKEAAEVAAETAPPAALYVSARGGESADNGSGGGPADNGSGSGGVQSDGGSNASGGRAGEAAGGGSLPAGSSGLGSVLGQATGAGTGGNIGLWLPLAIVATLAGAVAYRLRLGHGPTT